MFPPNPILFALGSNLYSTTIPLISYHHPSIIYIRDTTSHQPYYL